MTATQASTIRAHTHPERHILSRWTLVELEPRLARGYDWPAVWEGLVVVSRGNSSPTSTNGAGSGWSAADRDSAIAFEPGLQSPEARQASRNLRKRHMSFICAVRDVFYYS
jgi:hypothetical protein